jgi:hypothetical protein
VCPPDPPVFAIPSCESLESAIKAAVIKAKEAIDSEKSKNDIVLRESQTPNFQRTRTREKFPEAAGRRAGSRPQSPATKLRIPRSDSAQHDKGLEGFFAARKSRSSTGAEQPRHPRKPKTGCPGDPTCATRVSTLPASVVEQGGWVARGARVKCFCGGGFVKTAGRRFCGCTNSLLIRLEKWATVGHFISIRKRANFATEKPHHR